jgi:hypothetical protein
MAPDSYKRKRGAVDAGPTRQSPSIRTAAAAAAAAAVAASQVTQEDAANSGFDDEGLSQLIAHNAATAEPNGSSGGAPGAAQTAQAALTHYQVPDSFSSGGHGDVTPGQSHHYSVDHSFPLSALKDATSQGDSAVGNAQSPDNPSGTNSQGGPKPPVGSVEWHRIRRDNHKEVERRRREAINEGINELSKIVPGCEKNKGSILQRAVQYIGQLKENEQANIEKWTLEKLLLDQALNELSSQNDRFKAELDAVMGERDAYRKTLEENEIEVPEVEGVAVGEDEKEKDDK